MSRGQLAAKVTATAVHARSLMHTDPEIALDDGVNIDLNHLIGFISSSTSNKPTTNIGQMAIDWL